METRRLTKMALLTALLCISAYISFPLPFSPAMVTALTLVATLIGLLLQPKDALIVFIVYVLLGTVGLPVFVGGTGGFGKLFGPTGGFIFSWPVAYTLLSVYKGNKRSFTSYAWRSIVITIPIVYLFGVTGYMLVTNTDLWAALVAVMFPFIPGDIFKCLVASWLATKVKI
ncbi:MULTISPECIES: biotin transporter BioY [Veillonella]|uniref:biotin transporter BioY n=1 Tax=Veillonella TaxID=29465 RepID=UPI0003E23C0A|nr:MULTISPECIES: biotin transporter BioY [Veillonella]ETS93628.1 BioY family protein [Veillonella sp. AS16]